MCIYFINIYRPSQGNFINSFVKLNEGGKIMACKKGCKHTSKTVASKASKALRDGRSSSRTKSIAASVLSQREK